MIDRRTRSRVSVFGMLPVFACTLASAQVGSGWVEYTPEQVVHLELYGQDNPTSYPWSNYASYGNPVQADYAYDAATETSTFKIYGSRANRSEIRLKNEYEFGSRQFEGYVTIFPPLEDESLFQIWGSSSGATQMMLRGFAANNGSLKVNCVNSSPLLRGNLYGKEIKVNVIHLQEDVGNRIYVYLDGVKAWDFADNEKATNHDNKNYHKYGCYGTVPKGHESPMVKWRKVRCFKDGRETGIQLSISMRGFGNPVSAGRFAGAAQAVQVSDIRGRNLGRFSPPGDLLPCALGLNFGLTGKNEISVARLKPLATE